MNPAYLQCVLALDHLVLAACGLWLALAAAPAPAAELWIGAATADITPDRPVPLTGNTSVRIGREIQSRLTANILALESRGGERSLDQAILIACDLCVSATVMNNLVGPEGGQVLVDRSVELINILW